MDQRRKKRRAVLQNITIVLLTVSAVALCVQTQLYNLGGSSMLSDLFVSAAAQKTPSVSGLSDLSAPVRIAVSGAYGRWADLSTATGSEAFSAPGSLLMEAVGSAGPVRECRTEEFRVALRTGPDAGVSVYFDFGSPLPVSYLAGLAGAEWTGGTLNVRRVLLAAEGGSVRLFLWDGETVCRVCSTALPAQSVEELAASYPLGSAWFAFDQPEACGHVDPYSLFSEQFTPPPALSASGTLTDVSALMSALSFNPHTNFRYAEASGAEVVVEGERTLRIRTDGEVTYQGSGDALRAAPENAGQAQTLVCVFQLLSRLLATQGSAAELYLQDVQTSGSIRTLRFGYHSGGLPIRLSSGSCAAEVTLDGQSVIQLTLRLRRYETAGESAEPLLPLTQALSIARRYPGRELALCYVDGGGSASVQWLAE
mgnify:FL=1